MQISNSNKPTHMHTNAIIASIIIFAVIVLGMFIFSFLKKEEIQQEVPADIQVQQVQQIPYEQVTSITAKHYLIDGVHTFVGEIELPTPCDLLESQAIVQESDPEQIIIDFSVLNNSEACVQQITQQRFKVSASASAQARIKAFFMGREVPLNLIPAEPGETPEEFELFVKG